MTALLDNRHFRDEVSDVYARTGSLVSCAALLQLEARALSRRGTRDLAVIAARHEWEREVVAHDLAQLVDAIEAGDVVFDPDFVERERAERERADRKLREYAAAAIVPDELDSELDDAALDDELVDVTAEIELEDVAPDDFELDESDSELAP